MSKRRLRNMGFNSNRDWGSRAIGFKKAYLQSWCFEHEKWEMQTNPRSCFFKAVYGKRESVQVDLPKENPTA